MTEREALKLALEALERCGSESYTLERNAITAIKEALAQPEYNATSDQRLMKMPEQELTTTLKASIHAGLDKKNDNKTQVDHHGKQPEQEPVEWGVDWGPDGNSVSIIKRLAGGGIEVVGWEYAPHPPQRTWVGLTNDELNMIGDRMRTWNSHSLADVYVAIEAKLKEKNT